MRRVIALTAAYVALAVCFDVALAQTGHWRTIQVFSTKDEDKAVQAMLQLNEANYPSYYSAAEQAVGRVFRVRVGKYRSQEEASTHLARLKEKLPRLAAEAIVVDFDAQDPMVFSSAWLALNEFKDRAQAAVEAMRTGKAQALARFIHPGKGVRFSPYAFVQPMTDIAFTQAQLVEAASSSEKLRWGTDYATSQPLEMPFAEYFKRYVYDKDYAAAQRVGFNQAIGSGSMIQNHNEMYPEAVSVEYYVPEPGAVPGNATARNFKSLRLLFEHSDDQWWLVGIVHDDGFHEQQ